MGKRKLIVSLLLGTLLLTAVGCNINEETSSEVVESSATEEISEESVVSSEASSSEAQIATKIEVLEKDVYERKDEGYEIKVVTPMISGFTDISKEADLNRKLEEDAIVVKMEADKDIDELLENAKEGTKINTSYIYDFTVKGDSEKYLSFDVTKLLIKADGYETHTMYNINKENEAVVELKDLFLDEVNYVDVLSKEIVAQMEEQIKTGEKTYFLGENAAKPGEAFRAIKENQNFYVDNSGEIVICFDQLEVAASYMGSPEFVIPVDKVKDIVK